MCRKNFCVVFLFLFSCQTLFVKPKRLFDGSQGKYELTTPNIVKIYNSKDGTLMKEGQVQIDCPKNSCDQNKIKEISLSQIESSLKKKQGEWREYVYKDGKQFLERKGLYKDNKKEGEWREYVYKDGKSFLERKGLYKDNKKEGEWKEYIYKDGKQFLKRKGDYKDSKKEGIWEEYIQKKTRRGKWENHLLKKITYKDDKRNGPWKQLRENGKALKRGTYRNGLKEEEEYKYSKDDKQVESKIYKNGKLNGKYWKKHKVCAEGEKQDIKKTKKKCKDYKYAIKGFYKNGLKDSIWTTYYKDGAIKKKSIYQKDKLNGSDKNYYYNGTLQSEGNNSNDFKIGRWKFYYPNGVKNAEGEYQYDSSKQKSLKVGIWKEYYSNGQLFATGFRKHTQTGKWIFYFPNKQKAAEGEMTNEFTMSEGTIYDRKGLIVGKGKLQISIFKINPTSVGDPDFLKRKYEAGVSFPYYGKSKKSEQKKFCSTIYECYYNSLKMKYRAGVPFIYYKEGKKYLEVRSNDIAVEYDSEGRKFAEGPVISGSTKKNGCWSRVDGKKVYYINNKIKKGKIAELQKCG